MDEGKLSYTMGEAASATGMTRSRLYKAMGERRLATFLVGRRRMVSRKALEDFIAKLERESAGRAA